MTKELIQSVAILIIIFLLISGIEIDFSPFRVRMPYWLKGVGTAITVIGIMILMINSRMEGYRQGFQSGSDKTIEILKTLKDHPSDEGKEESL